MKNVNSLKLLAIAVGLAGSSHLAVGQEKEKKVELHLVKEINGEKITLDTTFVLEDGQSMSDIELHAPWNEIAVDNDVHVVKGHGDTEFHSIRVEQDGDGEVKEIKVWVDDEGSTHHLQGGQTFFIETDMDQDGEHNSKKHVIIIGEDNVEIRGADDIVFEREGNTLIEVKNGDENVFVVRVRHEKMDEDELEDLRKAIDGSYEVAEDGLEVSDFMVFPNPSDGDIKVAFETSSEINVNLYVFDQAGKRVYSELLKKVEGAETIEVDLTNQPAGIYYVNLTDGSTSSTRKIVID